jgi:hypothetical protein
MSASVDDILKKYGAKIEGQIAVDESARANHDSKEYSSFRDESFPELTKYEKVCKNIGKSLKIKASKKDKEKIARDLEIAHLDLVPEEVLSFAALLLILTFVVSVIISISILMIKGANSINDFPFLLFFMLFFFGMFLFFYAFNAPSRMARSWRLKASSQMVPCILYIVIYMRHTSNLERAVKFAADHLQPPLSFDLKKIFWDVEVGKFSTIKESVDYYLETWRDYSPEFIEAFHLIESSLYEPSEGARIKTLETSLEVILDGIHEKMLKYTHDVKSPLTNLYMLGIILPTMGLSLLPLGAALLQGMIKWYHISILFNMLVPFMVFYLTSDVLAKRPGGYGETDLLEQNPDYSSYSSRKPYYIAGALALPFLIISILPFLINYTSLGNILFGPTRDFAFLGMNFIDFMVVTTGTTQTTVGPFGVGAVILSLFFPISMVIFFVTAFSLKTKKIAKTKYQTKNLEQEFTSSLFQLGNRLGDGIPAEIAFGKVAESSKGTSTEDFFRIVNSNMQRVGMSLEQALFNKNNGAVIIYPSDLIKTSMHILIEAVKKGLKVAAMALMNISQYVKNIRKINERLNDLLADIKSDMKSNMTFLAPVLAGIVIGLSTMITLIFSKLSGVLGDAGSPEGGSFGVDVGNILNMFQIETMIPPYFLQITVAIYLIEIIFILTGTLVVIDRGVDKLEEKMELTKTLKSGILVYLITSFISTLALSLLANFAIKV